MTIRAQSIPARHYFPEHAHRWHQVVYAISGVLTVAVERRSFVISPEQAVWLPTGLRHRVGTLLGAEFRSLWIADEAGQGLPESPTVFAVTPLLQALIIEVAEIEAQGGPRRLRRPRHASDPRPTPARAAPPGRPPLAAHRRPGETL
ncbi:AraC family ligand binding domain-containing protein [Siccirubricoccus sp. G192]|uniref:AraC family ligand binding domain-containing protein n=1 Tax=Siccirubricoccus sp. G192 TaxID=2849651 RepID=UPI001C2BD536|nr:AraC family ligand binding domain-containing protein [Siccirubricoccus sp. G192]MBV1795651.1 cupin domain-containing protein [Siccirubricoccus sp. G192]